MVGPTGHSARSHSVTELAYPETPYTVDVCYKSEERLRTDRVVEGMLC